MNILLDSKYYEFWRDYTHLKQSSIVSYTGILKKFGNYLAFRSYTSELDFEKFYYYQDSSEYYPINEAFIEEYIEYLKCHGATNFILYNTIVGLKSFFEFLVKVRMIRKNPVSNIKNSYYDRRIIDRSLSTKEYKRILQTAFKSDPFFKQRFVLIYLMLITGLRNSEVIKLTFNQIDFDRNIIYVDQGHKTIANSIYIPNVLASYLLEYFNHPHYESWQQQGNKEVFFNASNRLSNKKLNSIIKSICYQAGIKRNVTARDFRNTAAYIMQKSGFEFTVIQRQMRHRHPSTTLRYLPPISKQFKILNDNELI